MTHIILSLLLPSLVIASEGQIKGNKKVESFRDGKKLIKKAYASLESKTLYCACKFTKDGPNRESCKYKPKNESSRSKRIEWEHVVPASKFGKKLGAWTKGHKKCVTSSGNKYKGRRCARKVSEAFRLMEADMHNLYPAIGEINGRRSNYRMAMLSSEKRDFGQCDVEIRDQKIEPKEDVRGDIARAYFYMHLSYPKFKILSTEEIKLFKKWNKKDPVSPQECKRQDQIKKLQGNYNHVTEYRCRKSGL